MRIRTFILFAATAVAAGLVGCQSIPPGATGPAPVLDSNLASSAGLTVQDASLAADLYVAKCARCHKFYDPGAYTETEWRSWMGKMSKKSHLEADQEGLLARYLGAFRVNPQASATR